MCFYLTEGKKKRIFDMVNLLHSGKHDKLAFMCHCREIKKEKSWWENKHWVTGSLLCIRPHHILYLIVFL